MRPVYDALNSEKFKNQIQFHMPGHLRGRGFEGFAPSSDIDVTELFETDSLHNPTGVIKASQEHAAKIFGAKSAYYMVNGSTGGVLAMVLGFLGEGDKVIADRFCHKSFVSALALSGAEAVWVLPDTMRGGTMWSGVGAEKIKRAIAENPDAKAVYLTAPSYFGLTEDIPAIARLAHENGMKLLIDGAHGAHYGFCGKLPPKIISMGADAVCLSLHKTLPALTQSAMLLTNERYGRVEAALKTVQTSSPSYLLTASCEYAASFCERGASEWERLFDIVRKYFPTEIEYGEKCVKYSDFTRINAAVSGNSFEAVRKLREEFNIAVECAYGGGVTAILTPFHTEAEIAALRRALDKIRGGEKCDLIFSPARTRAVCGAREAFFAKKRRVLLREAEGKVSGEGFTVYPPGIYQLLPGEIITKEALERLEALSASGAEIPQIEQSYCLIFDE